MASKTSDATPVHSMTMSGCGTGVLDPARVVRGAQRVHEVGLGARRHLVEDVDVEPPLHPDQGGQQADGAGPGDDDGLGVPVGAAPDAVDLLPGLGHHAGGLQEHPERPEAGIDLDGEVGMDAVALRAVPVAGS